EECRIDGGADGCAQPADGLNGQTVAQCSANPYDTTDTTVNCADNLAFNAERTARNTLCTSAPSGSDPFNGLCDVFTGGSRDIVAQRTAHCSTSRINPWDVKCEGALVTAGDADIAEARTNVCINNTEIRTGSETVTQALFDSRCDDRMNKAATTVTQTRFPYCNGEISGLRGAGGTPALCKDTALSGVICGTVDASGSVAGSNPFAEICTESSGAALVENFNANEARAALALTCRTTEAANCSATITGTSSGTSFRDCSLNPYLMTDNCHTNGAFTTEREARETLCTTSATSFDTLCNNIVTASNTDISAFSDALAIARGRGCLDGVQGATGCGAENDNSGDYVDVYCNAKGITDITNCPSNYASQNATAVTDVSVPAIGTGENQLLTSDGKDPLTIIKTSVGASGVNDADANFIEGGASGLTLGGDSATATTPAPLTLNGVGGGTDTNDGFALSTGTFAGNVTKLYVGLLSGTGLGAPLDAGKTGGTWNASLRVISNGALQAVQTFKLAVNFGGTNDTNTIGVTGAELNVTNLGVITINGKFTANGVIYGTVDFAGANAGTLTGLVGQEGAVGIFASNSGSAYVGGFVAAPDADNQVGNINCTADGVDADPFNADCTSLANYNLQAQLCANNGVTAVTTFGSATFDMNCRDNMEVTNRVCTATGTYANPFDNAICVNAGSQVANQQSYCSNGDNTWLTACNTYENVVAVMNARAAICLADGQITTGTVAAPVGEVTAGNSLFNTLCDGLVAAGGETVLSKRQTQCSDGTESDVALCNKSEITNVVCASNPATNVNPFAMVCATAISGTLATVQQTFCGNTPRTALRNNGCDGL
ncbi:MAG: hypothetical protein K8953_06605, partial [Proteobacteria bacterium]|nr:hypothetical protein [Pseudomonadota bacterium]